MKSFILLLLFQLTLLAIGQPLKKLVDIDAPNKNIAHRRAHRYARALKPDPPTCSLNQYFDEDEGRCLGITGGGRVLYINSTNSCGINTLQPHCTNPGYYYICKDNKTILAQCLQGQHFESRLQKCVNIDPNRLISSTVQPNLETFESIQLPECKKPGSFPVPDDCTLFYTCETNGHRMFHSIFSCPKDMAYNVETKMCSFSSSCKKENSAVSFCTPMITKEKRNIEKSTSTESLTHITDLDDTDKTTTYEIPTTENLEDSAITNTVSVTTYDNDEPTSTFSFNDFTSTEFTEVTVHVDLTASTERASKTTTIIDSSPETEKSVEGSTIEAVTETSIVDLITSNTEIGMVVKVVEESTVEATEVTAASTMAPADLSTGSTEIQTTEMEFTDSAAITKVSLNENENSNVLSTLGFNDANTEPTFLPTTTILTANNVQEPSANFNTNNVSSPSTIVSNSENNKQNTTSKENDIREKEFMTMLRVIHSRGRISANVILPIMSAVLSIIDTIDRHLIDILSRVQS
ncbi:uncharacterized protein LOC117606292 isoform X2 [Osmia lignaria lignaria]|uniref:uncharacterized protein LOC117606292 isoform X2 n=1 Tax=Osmia lignaria lignaria TaxID=1437193 RepID=UPI00402B1D29